MNLYKTLPKLKFVNLPLILTCNFISGVMKTRMHAHKSSILQNKLLLSEKVMSLDVKYEANFYILCTRIHNQCAMPQAKCQ